VCSLADWVASGVNHQRSDVTDATMASKGAKVAAGAGLSLSGVGVKRPRISVDINTIGNKLKRAEVLAKEKALKRADKRTRRDDRALARKELGAAAPPKEVRTCAT